jgi:salicylate hydroxylase
MWTAKQYLSPLRQILKHLLHPTLAIIPAFALLLLALRRHSKTRGARSMSSVAANDQPVEIAIVGGGIIGLILALGLIRRNVKVNIYEQARSFREIGAGVALTANAVRCMGMIEPGIVDALRAVATSNGDAKEPNDWLRWVDGFTQPTDNDDENDDREEKLLFKIYAGPRGFEGCHRAHFLDELIKLIPPTSSTSTNASPPSPTPHPPPPHNKEKSTSPSTTTPPPPPTPSSAATASNPASASSSSAPPTRTTPTKSPTALIPMPAALAALGTYKATNQHKHLGPRAHILHFPVANHTLMNVVAFVPDPTTPPRK